MPLWNKRAVSSGQTEESYKEQLQSLKQTVNNLGLVSEQFEGAAEGLTESSDKVGKRCIAMPENSRGIHSEDHGYGSGDCNYADTGSADAATE